MLDCAHIIQSQSKTGSLQGLVKVISSSHTHVHCSLSVIVIYTAAYVYKACQWSGTIEPSQCRYSSSYLSFIVCLHAEWRVTESNRLGKGYSSFSAKQTTNTQMQIESNRLLRRQQIQKYKYTTKAQVQRGE